MTESIISQTDQGNPAAKNALKHGCYSQVVVADWERQDEFDELHQQYRGELNPQGPLEDDIVMHIVQLQWWKRRLVRTQAMRFNCDPLAQELARAAEQGAAGIEAYLRERVVALQDKPKGDKTRMWTSRQVRAHMDKVKADEEVQKATHEMLVAKGWGVSDTDTETFSEAPEDVQRKLEERMKRALLAASERIDQQELGEQGSNGSIKTAVDRLVEQNELARASQSILDRLAGADDFDAFLKRVASLDARIEKGIARLAGVKEFKRMYGPKAVVEKTQR